MTDATRRGVAYIAGRLLAQRASTSVYDLAARKHFLFSGEVSPGNIAVYDYSNRCHISGTPGSIYHFGNRRHLSIEVSGRSFSGYDFHSRKHFSGTVSGSTISIYDFERGRHFNYVV